MGARDINIPFGPDKTGGIDLSNVIPQVVPDQPADGEQIEAAVVSAEGLDQATIAMPAADLSGLDVPAHDVAGDSGEVPAGVSAGDAARANAASEPMDVAAQMPEDMAGVDPAEVGVDEENPQALDDVQKSFAALRDSIGQGRELKAREKEREEFGEQLDADREELADREDILQNYHALVAEQDAIIEQQTQQRESRKAELAQLVADAEAASDELVRLRDYHTAQLQPLETALGRAKAGAEQAKNDERSRKSELNAAETELRRAEGDDATMAAARHEQVQISYDDAVARSNAAKEALDQAQKAYDDLKEQVDAAEAPLERNIADMDERIEELKESVARLGDAISAARKRRQYCDTVYQYPEETAKLRASVAADEETARQMDAEADELRERLAESKEQAKKAKFAIAGAAVLVVLIIILIFVFTH